MRGKLLKFNLHMTGLIFSVILLFSVSNMNFVISILIFFNLTLPAFSSHSFSLFLSFHRNHVFLRLFKDVQKFPAFYSDSYSRFYPVYWAFFFFLLIPPLDQWDSDQYLPVDLENWLSLVVCSIYLDAGHSPFFAPQRRDRHICSMTCLVRRAELSFKCSWLSHNKLHKCTATGILLSSQKQTKIWNPFCIAPINTF